MQILTLRPKEAAFFILVILGLTFWLRKGKMKRKNYRGAEMKVANTLAVILFAITILVLNPSMVKASESKKETVRMAQVIIEPYIKAPFVVENEPYKSNVAVMIPQSFIKDAHPVRVIVFFHGNEKIVGKEFADTINAEFSYAYGNSTDTILIAPQLSYNSTERAAGELEKEGGLYNLIFEALSKNGIFEQIKEITIVAYSGGYWAATNSLRNNPTLNITNVVFLDTLYWRAEDVLDWVEKGDKRVAVFCSKESKGVKQYVINTANYFFDAPTTEMGEGRFFTRSLTERFVVVKTRLPHDQILTLLGPVLKKLQTEGR